MYNLWVNKGGLVNKYSVDQMMGISESDGWYLTLFELILKELAEELHILIKK